MTAKLVLHVEAISRCPHTLAGNGAGAGASVPGGRSTHVAGTSQVLTHANVLLWRSARRLGVAGQARGQCELSTGAIRDWTRTGLNRVACGGTRAQNGRVPASKTGGTRSRFLQVSQAGISMEYQLSWRATYAFIDDRVVVAEVR